MTPTLFGRIQTRVIILATLGALWTALIGPLLPRPDGVSLGGMYRALFTALFVVAVVGIAWEVLYHGLQQFRWEKDWPTIFGLVVAIPEGIVAYALLDAGLPWDVRAPDGNFPLTAFVIMFVTLWFLVWAFTNGPMQIFSLRWRYRGGRFDSTW